jgi:hypothetical protein
MEGDKPKTKRFADYPIGYRPIDIAEVRTEEGELYLLVAIDRTSKLAFAKRETEADRSTASDLLQALVAFVPYRSTRCSPTTVSSSAMPRATAQARRPSTAGTCSTASATNTASSIA